MKRLTIFFTCAIFYFHTNAQLLTWTPEFPKDNDNISITVDATKGNQALNNYSPVSDVYIHTGVITNLSTSPTDWRYVKFNQNFNQPNAQLQATSLGSNKWRFDINNIRAYYGVPAGETILKLTVLFRNGAGTVKQANINGSDMYIPVYDNNVGVRFTVPSMQPTYNRVPEPISKQAGDNISLTAIASKPATLKLFLNGNEVQSAINATTISANPVLPTAGNHTIRVDAIDGATTRSESFELFVAPGINILPLPAGVRDGVNFEAGNTSATLVLYAPGKTRVTIIGEFPGAAWNEQAAMVMNKTPDGNYFWLRLTGLTPGNEYAYQYLVDGTLKIADPYTRKVLDPHNNNDGFITSTTYPGLRSYPAGQTGIVSILQTNPPAYNWAVSNFQRPDKRNLITYELLVRDFVDAHNWNTVRDSLPYLKKLGINAIELMPFNEFEGNNSWGYNPDFYFAPDKYYGPENTLKQFIDSCHKNGIAVIMDIALNHSFGLSPLVQLYWDAANNRPAANNPWFNPVPKHAFNVGFDMNHESLATRYFTSRVIEHWVTEFKIDGFRFDLSKGFTQTQTCDANGANCNVGAMGNYDASRVAIWKKYYDTLQLKAPGAYAILEHFADDPEEIELSNYGMLFWGNSNYNYNEASMGWVPSSNFERAIHTARGWAQPYLMSYMESHDEERLMYKNLNFGNASGPYNTRDMNTALKRMGMNAAFFLTIPGPKMIWQFGELGYDYSITSCHPGNTIPQPYPSQNCRLDAKPIRWDYLQNPERKKLFDIYSSLNRLRVHPFYKDIFIANSISSARNLAGAAKTLTFRSALDSSIISVIGNFDVVPQTLSYTFPVAGTWYDYLNGTTISATGNAQNFSLQPGEYHVFLNRNTGTTPPPFPVIPVNQLTAAVYYNPLALTINLPANGFVRVQLLNSAGQHMKNIFSGTRTTGPHIIPLTDKMNNLATGIYILKVQSGNKAVSVRFVK